MPILSPCRKTCVLDPASRLCEGCGRSATEIESWTRYDDAERARVMADLPRRLATLAAGAPARNRA
ncbi:MAG: DUF1289 domain-containing protein [Proteobacteria bacterium]|nr:DUF1289 domain-containing protein [Pseudomonadota bacterium]